MSGAAGTVAPETVDAAGEVLEPALEVLEGLGSVDAPAEQDQAPRLGRRKRSGTSGAERARRAKAGTSSSSTPPKARAPRARAAAPKIADGMAQLYVMAGMAATMVPTGPAAHDPSVSVSQATGQALVANAGGIGAAWEQAAKDDPRIREALERLLSVSTYGQIVAAHLPVVMVGMGAAGAIPRETMVTLGMVAPAPDPT